MHIGQSNNSQIFMDICIRSNDTSDVDELVVSDTLTHLLRSIFMLRILVMFEMC